MKLPIQKRTVKLWAVRFMPWHALDLIQVSKLSQTLASPKIENLVAGCKQCSEVPKGDQ